MKPHRNDKSSQGNALSIPTMASSSSSSETPASPSQSLLQKLKPNYDGNQSCHQCLRSKVTPSAVVVAMLEDNPTKWSAQILQQAHQLLLTSYIPLGNVESSMQAFVQWGTVIHFIQFVLSLPPNSNLPPNQVIVIASQLIQSMTTELANVPIGTDTTTSSQASQHSSNNCSNHGGTQESNDDDGESSVVLSQQDATQSLDRRLVAFYCFQSLLRLNHFAQSQIGLVAPVWKGICSVHKASSIPSVLLEQAIQQVLKMLREGFPRLTTSLITATSQPNSIQNDMVTSFVMQGKLISFLALRLSNLMGTRHGSKKTRSKAYKQLLLLQGMHLVPQSSLLEPFSKTCAEIASKTCKALMETMIDSDGTLNRPALDALIPIAISPPKDGSTPDAIAELSYTGLHLAKVQFSIAILEKFAAVQNNDCLVENMDAILVLCESLYSIFLPQSYGLLMQSLWWQGSTMAQRFVDACLQPMATILVRIDAGLLPPSQQLHRLLVRWLAPYRSETLHPLSREVILTVLHLFLITSSNSQLLASLMVKLLLDPRTETGLRQNLSALIVTILASSNQSNAMLRALVLGRVEAEVQTLIPSKKRRRSNKGVSLKNYSLEDVKAITAVLVHLSTSSQSLMEAMQKLAQQLQGGKENPRSIPKLSKVEWNCMVMALLQGTLLGKPDEFQSKLGMSLLEFQRRVILTVVSFQQSSDARAMVQHCILCSAILRFCTHVCNGLYENREGSTQFVPIQELCRLVKYCTSKAFLSKAQDPASHKQCRSFVVFDTIRLMEAIAFGIPQGCPPAALDTLKDVFVRLFSSNSWTVVSQTIGSLVWFGQRLDKSHQQLLPSCLPAAQQPLFRTRMLSNRGQVHFRQLGATDPSSWSIGKRLLIGHCEKREIGKTVFPSTSTMEIPAGSYFIRMPSQGGRHAWVVFEPSPESIQDIKYMRGLGEDDDAPEDIQKLKRALVVEKGGLSCLLQSL